MQEGVYTVLPFLLANFRAKYAETVGGGGGATAATGAAAAFARVVPITLGDVAEIFSLRPGAEATTGGPKSGQVFVNFDQLNAASAAAVRAMPIGSFAAVLDDEADARYRVLARVDAAGAGSGAGNGGGAACPLAGAARSLALTMWRGRSSMTLMMNKQELAGLVRHFKGLGVGEAVIAQEQAAGAGAGAGTTSLRASGLTQMIDAAVAGDGPGDAAAHRRQHSLETLESVQEEEEGAAALRAAAAAAVTVADGVGIEAGGLSPIPGACGASLQRWSSVVMDVDDAAKASAAAVVGVTLAGGAAGGAAGGGGEDVEMPAAEK